MNKNQEISFIDIDNEIYWNQLSPLVIPYIFDHNRLVV